MIRLLQTVLLTTAALTAGTFEGTLVEDGSGNTITRGMVQAFAGTNNALIAEARSDVQGRFALVVPLATGYVVRASKPGYIGVEIAVSGALPDPLRLRMPKLATFEGEVRQQDGAPVPGAPVVALWRALASSVPTRTVIVRADDSGRFRFANLLPGYYTFVCATHLALPDRARDREILVSPGDQLTDTFTLAASTGYHLSGHNVAGAGPGFFHLFKLGPPDVLARSSGSADGTFRFDGLPSGVYQLIEDLPGHGPANGGATIRLDGDLDGVVPAPSAPSVVPVVVDSPETCGPEASVVVERLLDLPNYFPAVTTNVRGNASLMLAPGSYRVTARSKDGQCGSPGETGLRVGGNGHDPGIRLALSPKTVVSGTVSKQALVVLMPLSAVEPLWLRVAVAGEDGRFVFSDVLPGTYLAAARPMEDRQAKWLAAGGSRFSISGEAMTIDVNQQ